MEISDVKVKLMGDRSDRLKAFCSITIDDEFVIRDLKIIDGTNGTFVAMPSRKITDKCPACGAKNHLRSKFCNECGSRLNEHRAGKDADGRTKLHADIAHPINSVCRDRMQKKIIRAFDGEVERSKLPGYKPSYDEDFDDIDYVDHDGHHAAHGVERAPHPAPVQPPAARQQNGAGDGKDAFGAGIF